MSENRFRCILKDTEGIYRATHGCRHAVPTRNMLALQWPLPIRWTTTYLLHTKIQVDTPDNWPEWTQYKADGIVLRSDRQLQTETTQATMGNLFLIGNSPCRHVVVTYRGLCSAPRVAIEKLLLEDVNPGAKVRRCATYLQARHRKIEIYCQTVGIRVSLASERELVVWAKMDRRAWSIIYMCIDVWNDYPLVN